MSKEQIEAVFAKFDANKVTLSLLSYVIHWGPQMGAVDILQQPNMGFPLTPHPYYVAIKSLNRAKKNDLARKRQFACGNV